jgi:outer membrane protein OmpA-like peptidoglycan-associated protein
MTNGEDPAQRTEALINLADKLASQPVPPAARRKWPLFAVAGLAVAGAAVGAIAATSGGDTDDSADDTITVRTEPDPTTTVDTTTGIDQTTTAVLVSTETIAPTTAPATTVPDTTVPPSTSTSPTTTLSAPTTTVSTDPVLAQPVRWAEFTGGKVYLNGKVPDQATADEIRDKAAAVVGPANVVVNYQIVPGTPKPSSAPLYVRDSVLFEPGSTSINDAARGVLDLGVALMTQNPKVTIDIQGHTDSEGSAETNLQLSEKRVKAIFDYLVSKGIDPTRLTQQAYGESQPIADNATAAGRAKNRRVEFTINNLIG